MVTKSLPLRRECKVRFWIYLRAFETKCATIFVADVFVTKIHLKRCKSDMFLTKWSVLGHVFTLRRSLTTDSTQMYYEWSAYKSMYGEELQIN